MHKAVTSSDAKPSPSTLAPEESDIERRKFIRRIVMLLILVGALVITLYVWSVLERHPRTDDAAARANVVGIAPRVSGQILRMAVQDNQAVKKDDLLFELDPADFEQVLAKAKSVLAALDQQIAIGRAEDEQLRFGVKAAQAAVEGAAAHLKQTEDTLHRLEPLLPRHFTTAEVVDQARTSVAVATQALAGEEQKLNTARAQLSTLQTLLAQRPGAEAAVKLAELDLS